MKQQKAVKYAYSAGVIDADGCISIDKRNKRKKNRQLNPTYTLTVLVSGIDCRIHNFLKGVWGGRIYQQLRKEDNKNTIYRWEIVNSKAKEMLKKILPFLRYKKKQAELAIRFQIIKEKQNPNGWRWETLTKKELQIRRELHKKIQELKKEFIPCRCRD